MNKKGKFYPDGIIYHRKNGVLHQSYHGTAAAILLQEEVESLNTIIEKMYDERMPEDFDPVLEEIQSRIESILTTGVSRMAAMHSLLGAYDMDDEGKVSKAESDRIDWSKYQSPHEPHLKLVRDKA